METAGKRGDCMGTDGLLPTHSMFADDTALFASSRRALIAMTKDVRSALAEHGPNLNLDKRIAQRLVLTYGRCTLTSRENGFQSFLYQKASRH